MAGDSIRLTDQRVNYNWSNIGWATTVLWYQIPNASFSLSQCPLPTDSLKLQEITLWPVAAFFISSRAGPTPPSIEMPPIWTMVGSSDYLRIRAPSVVLFPSKCQAGEVGETENDWERRMDRKDSWNKSTKFPQPLYRGHLKTGPTLPSDDEHDRFLPPHCRHAAHACCGFTQYFQQEP